MTVTGEKTTDLIAKSRKDARLAGVKKYYALKPCRHDGTHVRYTESGACLECGRRARMRYDERQQGKFTFVTVEVRRKHVKLLREIATAMRIQAK